MMSIKQASTIELLTAARKIADYSSREFGENLTLSNRRAAFNHMGAVLADSVLQAGLNYATVVRPRIEYIIKQFPTTDTVSSLLTLINEGQTASILQWKHHLKIMRFELLVKFMYQENVEATDDLRIRLRDENFKSGLLSINGVGPKTVDYMACLVGIESIAVDRHVRAYAKKVGIVNDDYYFLQRAFSYAADLMNTSRRDFDSWLWQVSSLKLKPQLELSI